MNNNLYFTGDRAIDQVLLLHCAQEHPGQRPQGRHALPRQLCQGILDYCFMVETCCMHFGFISKDLYHLKYKAKIGT